MKSSSVWSREAVISVTSPPHTGQSGFFSYWKVCVYGDSVPEYCLAAGTETDQVLLPCPTRKDARGCAGGGHAHVVVKVRSGGGGDLEGFVAARCGDDGIRGCDGGDLARAKQAAVSSPLYKACRPDLTPPHNVLDDALSERPGDPFDLEVCRALARALEQPADVVRIVRVHLLVLEHARPLED